MNGAQKVPVSIFFFPNGMAACCDQNGEQLPKYQGRHNAVIEALKADGYDWRELPEVMGAPDVESYALADIIVKAHSPRES